MAHREHMRHLKRTGYWGRRAAGCIFLAQDSGRLCFALRSKHALEPLTYGTWGGAIDGEETPQDAVLREAREEAGIVPEPHQITPLFVFRHGEIFQYHNFLVTFDAEFEPILNLENAGFSWVRFGDWPEPLHPGADALLRDDASLQVIRQHVSIAS